MSGKWPNNFEKEYFENLRKEITGLLVLWYQWGALFDQPEDRLKEMGRAGNLLFGSIERVFYRDVVLGICRVTDPEKQGRNGLNHNISISHFQSGSYWEDSNLRELVEGALEKSKPLRRWRDKRLSHIDVNTGIGWELPKGCDRNAVSQSLEDICAVLRHVSRTVGETDILLGGEHTGLLQHQVRAPIERTLHYLLQGYQHIAPEK